MMTVICVLTKNEWSQIYFKANNKSVNFPAKYLVNLTMSLLKKYHLKEMCMIFQLITMPLINSTYLTLTG